MIHPRTNVVILRKIENLGLVSQATKGLRIDDPMNVPLENLSGNICVFCGSRRHARLYGCVWLGNNSLSELLNSGISSPQRNPSVSRQSRPLTFGTPNSC